MRVLLTVAIFTIIITSVATAADTVVIYDGTQIKGNGVQVQDGRLEFRVEGEKEVRNLALGDVAQIKLVPPPPNPERYGTTRVIDNDGFHGPTEKSGKMKLRQGLHQMTILFFQGTQGASLEFSWEGPGINKQTVPRDAIVKWNKNQNEVTLSPGMDEEGFRQPDTIDETLNQIGYKLYEWTQNGLVSEVGDLRNLVLKKYGSTQQVDLNFQHAATNFGAVFYGLLKVPKDGEYTFYLKSDDGSQLYIGKAPPISQPTVRDPAADDWHFELADESRFDMPLSGWDEQGCRGAFKVGGRETEFVIPPNYLRELWSREYADKQDQIDRGGEPLDADTVYAKNADGQIQQVSGTVLGIDEESLKFEFQGEERTIGLERVAAVVMRKDNPPAPPDSKRLRLRFDLCGTNEFVGHLTELEGSAVVELPWGQSVTLNRNLIYKMQVLNGRMQSLQELEPADVAQTPFFDRIVPWQAGESLTGGSLRIGGKDYSKGLCLHSRTKLTYDLGGEFERFQCDLGLQQPDGAEGNATVRIAADGAELFVAEEVTAEGDPRSLDLDIAGKNQLTLEVDFGRRMDIGDHVVFGDARLLRPERSQ